MAKQGVAILHLYKTKQDVDLSMFGISLTNGAVAALLTPPPLKASIQNKSRLRDGAEYLNPNVRYDERTLNLPMHIVAENLEQFISQYDRFCAVLKQGEFGLTCSYIPNKTFKLIYVSCTQFSTYGLKSSSGTKYAPFVLRVIEPNPEDRQ